MYGEPVPKKIGGKTYWYLREMARVGGKPKMVSERYLGTAADIAAAVQAREAAVLPERTRHLDFGAVAAAWGVLEDTGAAVIIDEATGARPAGQPLPTGTYLALAALNRLVGSVLQAGVRGLVEDDCRGPVRQDPASALDHCRFWDAMHAVLVEQLEEMSQRIAVRIVQASGWTCPRWRWT